MLKEDNGEGITDRADSLEGDDPRFRMNRSQKVLKTTFLVLVWVCMGLFLEITGPTLIDLKTRLGANYEEVAVAISGQSVGFFIGSVIGGVLVDRFLGHCDLMIGVCLTGAAVATVCVPLSPGVELLWFIVVFQGTFEGIMNIVGQKLILLLWKQKAASPLHILQGGFGIGSFVIQLIANPFLAVPSTHQTRRNATLLDFMMNDTPATNSTITTVLPENRQTSSDSVFNSTVHQSLETSEVYIRESKIEYAYLISAIITLALSVVFYIYHVQNRKLHMNKIKAKGENKCDGSKSRSFIKRCLLMASPGTCTQGKTLYGIELFTVLFLYFVNIVGGERILGKFIRAYSIEQLDFSVDSGSYLNTAFWISFAVGRIGGFVTARFIPIRFLILLETGGVFAFSVLLNIFAINNAIALWILVQPLALFHAPCYPSGIGWADYHMEVTGMALTFLSLGGAVGGITYLKIIGFLFETYGPRAFLFHVLGYGAAAFALTITLTVIGARHGSRFVESGKKTKESSANIKKEEQELNLLSKKEENDGIVL